MIGVVDNPTARVVLPLDKAVITPPGYTYRCLEPDIKNWLDENFGRSNVENPRWSTFIDTMKGVVYFIFRDEEDGLLFKMTWGGK